VRQRRVELTPKALEDLDDIYDLVATASSRRIAIKFIGRIEAFCLTLDYASERGTHHSHIREGLRSVGFDRRVTIIFQVTDEAVFVARFFYAGADWEADIVDL